MIVFRRHLILSVFAAASLTALCVIVLRHEYVSVTAENEIEEPTSPEEGLEAVALRRQHDATAEVHSGVVEHRPFGDGDAHDMRVENKAQTNSEPRDPIPFGEEASELELAEAKKAVGRPFPLSPSMMRTCATLDPENSRCPTLAAFLDQFSNESRDLAWARKMEELLEVAVSDAAPGQFNVRAIECRTARCAVEVAAPYEFYLGHFSEDSEISRLLYGPTVGDLGFETDSNGNRVIVTALGFERLYSSGKLPSQTTPEN